MLCKLYSFITNTKSYKDYAARRILLDSTMMTITHEYVKSLTRDPEELVDQFHKNSLEATEIRNRFCRRHAIYTRIFDYTLKRGLE